jgi:hypothetical protein
VSTTDLMTIGGFLALNAGPLLALLFRTEARITRLETIIERALNVR